MGVVFDLNFGDYGDPLGSTMVSKDEEFCGLCLCVKFEDPTPDCFSIISIANFITTAMTMATE
jgi:hypothetical protein